VAVRRACRRGATAPTATSPAGCAPTCPSPPAHPLGGRLLGGGEITVRSRVIDVTAVTARPAVVLDLTTHGFLPRQQLRLLVGVGGPEHDGQAGLLGVLKSPHQPGLDRTQPAPPEHRPQPPAGGAASHTRAPTRRKTAHARGAAPVLHRCAMSVILTDGCDAPA
jgi:hypothetical protein